MKTAATVLFALLAAGSPPPKPKVEFKPLQRITNLAVSKCDAVVVFKLTVSDGGSEDYYCPRVVWEWEDGTQSSEESDCVPFDQAAKEDHTKTWTKSHSFHGTGSFPIRAYLCKASKRIRSIETTATITGWEGCPAYRGRSSVADEAAGIESQEPGERAPRTLSKEPCSEREN